MTIASLVQSVLLNTASLARDTERINSTLDGLASKVCRACGVLKPLTDYHRQSNAPLGRRARCRSCLCDGAAGYRIRREGNAFEDRECQQCGNAFRFFSALNSSRPGQGKYCSTACKAAAGRTDYTCEACGVTFNSWRSVPRRFCGLECAGRVTLETLTRGPHLYGSPAWRRDLREQILERDGRECQRCRSPFDLVVHHIVPWKVSRDNSPENLITVCRPCHGFIHGVAKSKDFVPVGGV